MRMFQPSLLLVVTLAPLCIPTLALAQQPEGMPSAEMMKRFQDPKAMERMAAQAEEMQKCMERIDQKALDALKVRAEAASQEIQRLCAAGKKDEALAKAVVLAKEMRSDTTMQQLRACTKGMEEMMQGMPWSHIPGASDRPDPTKDDICS